MVIEGTQASPGAYREARPARFSWIHFAAHAAANRTSPLDSALILSRGSSANDAAYQLSARDVMNVPATGEKIVIVDVSEPRRNVDRKLWTVRIFPH